MTSPVCLPLVLLGLHPRLPVLLLVLQEAGLAAEVAEGGDIGGS